MNYWKSVRVGFALVCCLGIGAARGAEVASYFDDYRYIYSVTPLPGESIRSFHIYSGLDECLSYAYWDMALPPGWFFNPETYDGRCVITFYTPGEPLAVGETASFSYSHYCDPCCHSWFLGDEGSPAPVGHVIDDDEQHTEPCDIPAPWNEQCGGPGLLLAPKYPEAVDADASSWGVLKAIYR